MGKAKAMMTEASTLAAMYDSAYTTTLTRARRSFLQSTEENTYSRVLVARWTRGIYTANVGSRMRMK